MKDVAALVLAGGRMGQYGVLTQNRAKGALTFAGTYRIVDFALSNLRNANIENVGLIIQYLPGSLIEHVGVGQPWDLHGYGRTLKIMPPFVGMEKTTWYKGTADAIYQNMNFVEDVKPEHVIVLSGEHVYHLDYTAVINAHRESNADITFVTRQISQEHQIGKFGYVLSDENRRVRNFYEKPASPPSDIISTGIYVFKRELLSRLLNENAPTGDHNLAKDVLQRYASELNCYEYRMHGYWDYLENIEDYFNAQFALLRDNDFEAIRHWRILTNLEFRGVGFAPPAAFGPAARVSGSMIGAKCMINGTVENSILSPGVFVAEGAMVRNSILMHDCDVNAGAQLNRVIADRDVLFEEQSKIGCLPNGELPSHADALSGPLTLIGKAALVGRNVCLSRGSQVRTRKHLTTQAAANAEV